MYANNSFLARLVGHYSYTTFASRLLWYGVSPTVVWLHTVGRFYGSSNATPAAEFSNKRVLSTQMVC
jgi:hypothetical protein